MSSFADYRFSVPTEADLGPSAQRQIKRFTTEIQETPGNQVILIDSNVTNPPHRIRNTHLSTCQYTPIHTCQLNGLKLFIVSFSDNLS